MTTVGGGLALLSPASAADDRGWSLPAMTAMTGPQAIEAVLRTDAPLEPGLWDSIVIHHSGRPSDTPETITARHVAPPLNLNGLGYHFVVGNGTRMADGEIHLGYRWLEQQLGAHVAGPAGETYNRSAIGICLVGDGERRPFTELQLERLVQLVGTLSAELGIPADRVHLHRELSRTVSPGQFFPADWFREQVREAAVQRG